MHKILLLVSILVLLTFAEGYTNTQLLNFVKNAASIVTSGSPIGWTGCSSNAISITSLQNVVSDANDISQWNIMGSPNKVISLFNDAASTCNQMANMLTMCYGTASLINSLDTAKVQFNTWASSIPSTGVTYPMQTVVQDLQTVASDISLLGYFSGAGNQWGNMMLYDL